MDPSRRSGAGPGQGLGVQAGAFKKFGGIVGARRERGKNREIVGGKRFRFPALETAKSWGNRQFETVTKPCKTLPHLNGSTKECPNRHSRT